MEVSEVWGYLAIYLLIFLLKAIHEIFASNAQDHPDRPCVVETKGPRSAQRIFTYQQINESSNQLAHYFLAHGCETGDVVMIYAYRG
jgi:L-2-aminoadipate reductase